MNNQSNRYMKKITAALMILGFVSIVSGQPVQESGDLEQFKETYNDQSSEVPEFLGNIIGGETVNINFKSNKTTKTIGAKFDGVEIQNISQSRYQDYTLEANITKTAIRSIGKSEQPYEELQNQLESDNITYKSRSLSATIKIKTFELLNEVASMTGLSL
jgi:hypothetical protein